MTTFDNPTPKPYLLGVGAVVTGRMFEFGVVVRMTSLQLSDARVFRWLVGDVVPRLVGGKLTIEVTP